MNERYWRRAAAQSDLTRAIAALLQYGFDPVAFRIELLEPKADIGQWDRWGSEGLVEVSSTAPARRTKFYKPAGGRWLGDFERDLAGGAFAACAA